MHKFLFYNVFIICLYMFRAPCAHRQEAIIVLYSIWYHHTCRWPSGAQVETRHTYRCDGCIITFWPRDDGRMALETYRGVE